MRLARRMSPRPSVSPWRTEVRRFRQHGVAARLLGECRDMTGGFEALGRLVEPEMPVPPEPEDAEVDRPGRRQRRLHAPALGRRIRRIAAKADPALRRHGEGAPHRALQVGGAARRVVGAEARPLVELDEARAREPLRRGGKQSVGASRRVPTREADQEIGLRASRLPDKRCRLSIQRFPIGQNRKVHLLSPRRVARGPRAWPRRS